MAVACKGHSLGMSVPVAVASLVYFIACLMTGHWLAMPITDGACLVRLLEGRRDRNGHCKAFIIRSTNIK